MEKREKRKAILNIIGAVILLGTLYGCVINCFTLFVVPISREGGIKREAVSLCLTIMFLSYMVSSSLSGSVYRRVRVKTAMIIASIVIPLFFFLNSLSLPFYFMYISSLVMGLLLPFVSFTSFSLLIRSTFKENAGFAIGIAFTGSGIGGMIWSVVLGRMIERIGYKASFGKAGIVMFLISITITLLFIDDSKVLIPDKEEKVTIAGTKGMARVMILSFLVGLTPLFISQSMVPKALDAGLDSAYASSLNAGFMALLCIMKVVMGKSYDKFGLNKTLFLGLLSGIISAIFTLFITIKSLFFPYLLFLSINGTIQSMAPSLLAKRITDEKTFSSVNGICVAFNYLGCALSPLILNMVYERKGSYDGVLLFDMGLIVISMILLFQGRIRQSKT